MAQRTPRFRFVLVFLTTLLLTFSPGVFPKLGHPGLATSRPPAQLTQSVPLDPLEERPDSLGDTTQLLQQGRYQEAATQLEQLLQTQPQPWVAAAAASNLALAYQGLSRPSDANRAIAQALSILTPLQAQAPANPSLYAQTLDIQATLQLRQGQVEAALASGRQAEALYRNLGDRPRLLQNQINQAQALKALGSFAEARRLLEAVTTSLKTEPDSLSKARALRLLGDTLQERGDLATARDLLSQSQEIARAQNSNLDEGSAAYSLALADRAELARSQTRGEQRLELLQQSLDRFQRVTEIASDPVLRTQAQLNQLELLLASLQSGLDLLPDLNDWLRRAAQQAQPRAALPASRRPEPKVSPTPEPKTTADQALAAAQAPEAAQLAQLSKTLDQLEQTLQLLQTLPPQLDRLPLGRASTYARINLAHQLSQLPAIAPGLLAKFPRQPGPKAGLAHPSQGPLQSKSQPHPKSTQDSTLRSLLQRLTPQQQALIQRAIALGQILEHRSASAHPDAATLLARAIQAATQLQDVRAEVSAQQNLGSLYLQAQRTAEARRLLEAATLKADAIGAYEVSSQGHWQLAQIARSSGETTQAIAACDAALNRNQAIRSDLVALDRDVQYTFRDSIDPVYRGCADIELQQKQPNYEKVRQILEDLQLAELHDYFREACIQGQIIKLDDIISRQTNSNTAVLYSIFLRDQLQIYAKLPGQPDLIPNTIAIDQAAFQSLLQRWLTQLKDAQGARDVEATGQQLYRLLIQPFEEKFQAEKIDTLIFVNDGPLRNVPMAALFDGQNYLIERYAIAISPGLQLFAPKPLNRRSLSTLAGGLVDIPTQYQLNTIKSTSAIVSELDKLGLLNQQPLLESAFTKSAFKEQLKNRPSPIVHLSTHASFSSQLNNLESSFVLMADGKVNLLEMSDLIRERDRTNTQPLELLVLGACKTAEGDNRASLGLSGLAIRSGARSTVGSLWGVYDDLSATLLGDFYQVLSQGQSRAKALQVAQRQAIKTLRSKNDLNSNWAAYVLIGNWL